MRIESIKLETPFAALGFAYNFKRNRPIYKYNYLPPAVSPSFGVFWSNTIAIFVKRQIGLATKVAIYIFIHNLI